jgi:hypothetical protein
MAHYTSEQGGKNIVDIIEEAEENMSILIYEFEYANEIMSKLGLMVSGNVYIILQMFIDYPEFLNMHIILNLSNGYKLMNDIIHNYNEKFSILDIYNFMQILFPECKSELLEMINVLQIKDYIESNANNVLNELISKDIFKDPYKIVDNNSLIKTFRELNNILSESHFPLYNEAHACDIRKRQVIIFESLINDDTSKYSRYSNLLPSLLKKLNTKKFADAVPQLHLYDIPDIINKRHSTCDYCKFRSIYSPYLIPIYDFTPFKTLKELKDISNADQNIKIALKIAIDYKEKYAPCSIVGSRYYSYIQTHDKSKIPLNLFDFDFTFNMIPAADECSQDIQIVLYDQKNDTCEIISKSHMSSALTPPTFENLTIKNPGEILDKKIYHKNIISNIHAAIKYIFKINNVVLINGHAPVPGEYEEVAGLYTLERPFVYFDFVASTTVPYKRTIYTKYNTYIILKYNDNRLSKANPSFIFGNRDNVFDKIRILCLNMGQSMQNESSDELVYILKMVEDLKLQIINSNM